MLVRAAAAPGDPCWRCGHACCPSLAAAQLGGMATGPRLRRLRQLAAPLRPLCTSARRPQPPLDASTLGIHADAPGSSSGGGAAAAAAAVGPWSHERDVAPPIGVTTTFEAAEDGHVYSRQSQPTRDRCESVLAALEATPGLPTPHALLYSSGLAACHAIMVALLPTTRRIVVSGGYHGTHQVIDILKELRAELDIIELPTVEDAEALLQPTDLVWLETPRNPMCEVYDIAGYANLSCKPAVVVDGTFAPPPMQRALALGATAVMHSTTKCECATPPSCHPASVPPGQSVMKQRHCLAVVCPDLSGHSDAVGGALCVDGIDCSGCRDDAGHRATSAGLGWQGGVGQRVTYSALERKSATSSALSLPPPHGTDASRSVAATRSASFARPLAPARG